MRRGAVVITWCRPSMRRQRDPYFTTMAPRLSMGQRRHLSADDGTEAGDPATLWVKEEEQHSVRPENLGGSGSYGVGLRFRQQSVGRTSQF